MRLKTPYPGQYPCFGYPSNHHLVNDDQPVTASLEGAPSDWFKRESSATAVLSGPNFHHIKQHHDFLIGCKNSRVIWL